ncbi:hypothetical protein D3C73_1431510 [compost metagenome]
MNDSISLKGRDRFAHAIDQFSVGDSARSLAYIQIHFPFERQDHLLARIVEQYHLLIPVF